MADLNNPLIKALEPLTSRVRTDVTAKKTNTGRSIWTKEPLTNELMAKHLNGGPGRGCGFIEPGKSVTLVMTFDLDSHKGEVSWERMVEVALMLMDVLEFMGMHPIPFASSGGSGIHIIVIWDTPQDAYSVRKFGEAALAAIGFMNGTKGVLHNQIEVFPKQDAVDIGSHGNQCILPLAGKSVPLEPLLGLERMPKEYALQIEWNGSAAVPFEVKPVVGSSASAKVSMEELVAALDAIPNSGAQELDYDTWRNVVFGIHHATGGSEEGLALAHKFSARASKYDKDTLEKRTWPYIKSKEGGITGRTVISVAYDHGWAGIPDVFEAVVADTPTGVPDKPAPKFKRDKHGHIEACIANCLEALRNTTYAGMVIRRDTFKDAIMYARNGDNQWMPFCDDDYTSLRESLERRGFKPIGREMIRDAVGLIARDNSFDSAIEWLNQQQWDGTDRVETFLTRYFGVPDSRYAREVSRYIWTALAGRVLVPGIKADMVPIFVGEQGIKKSTAVEAMSPHPDFFAEFNLADRDADMSRKMRGRLVGEIGELRGLHTKDLESIKSFITQTHEKWTPKFKEFEATFPRRLIFFGTTNQVEFLADPTGNRRFLPIRVGVVDLDAIKTDCAMLWAEGAALFTAQGIAFGDAEKLAESVHADHIITDPWADVVNQWLDQIDPITGEIPRTRKFLQTTDVLRECVGLDVKGIGKAQEMRIAAVLKQIGYIRKFLRVGKQPKWVYVSAVAT